MSDGTGKDCEFIEIKREQFRHHLSWYLQFFWHWQDYTITQVWVSTDNKRVFKVYFRPRYGYAYFLIRKIIKRNPRLSLISSVRIANMAAIVAAGLALNKDRKDAEVIAGSLQIRCSKPIDCDGKTPLPAYITLSEFQKNERFIKYHVTFKIGHNCEHEGDMHHFYMEPSLVRKPVT